MSTAGSAFTLRVSKASGGNTGSDPAVVVSLAFA